MPSSPLPSTGSPSTRSEGSSSAIAFTPTLKARAARQRNTGTGPPRRCRHGLSSSFRCRAIRGASPWSGKTSPPSFVADVHAFLAAKSDSDPLGDDYAKPTRPRTTEGRRKNLRLIASALVLSGQVAIGQLTSLAVLTEIENVRAALRYLRDDRANGKVTESHINQAYLLRTIARYWIKDAALTAEIKTLIANLSTHAGGSRSRGITPKNRERLRQFDIPENVLELRGLPERVLRAVGRKTEPTYQDAVRLMYALQVGILTFVPIRPGTWRNSSWKRISST